MVTRRGAGVGVSGGTGSSAVVRDWTLPTGAVAQTFDRSATTSNSGAILASGTMFLTGIYLPAGATVTSISWFSSTTAVVTPTAQWFSLWAADRTKLGVTSDDTTAAWAAEDKKTLTLAAPYAVTNSGLYYVGITVVAGTVPSLRVSTTTSRITMQVPILTGSSTTGLTNPASAPATAGALSAFGVAPYVFVS